MAGAGKMSSVHVTHWEPIEFTSVEPEMEPQRHGDHPGKVVKAMEGVGASWTLAHLLAEEASQIALRVFLLDNSGSTCQADGHMLVTSLGRTQPIPSSRWEEISSMAMEQAEWNASLGIPCEFVLLNPPGGLTEPSKEGRDFVTIDPKQGDPRAQVARLAELLKKNGPRGPTPLAYRIRQLTTRMRKVKDDRRIMLSVVTDGIPTSTESNAKDEFMRELRGFLDHLNAFVVIRLATDDDEVVKYYNRIDEELELPLDILDDLNGEAKELHAIGNGWFAYTPLLHRIREGGALNKLFDLLDERMLELPEIAEMLELLFRRPEDPPFPRSARQLYALAVQKSSNACNVFNGRKQCMTPPVDLKALKKALGLSPWQQVKHHLYQSILCAKNLPP